MFTLLNLKKLQKLYKNIGEQNRPMLNKIAHIQPSSRVPAISELLCKIEATINSTVYHERGIKQSHVFWKIMYQKPLRTGKSHINRNNTQFSWRAKMWRAGHITDLYYQAINLEITRQQYIQQKHHNRHHSSVTHRTPTKFQQNRLHKRNEYIARKQAQQELLRKAMQTLQSPGIAPWTSCKYS